MSIRKTFLRLATALFFLTLAGATYQGVTTAIERHQFKRPGGMVDAGGHQLHIYCTGAGAPTIVLEAPAAGNAAAWGWVQPRVSTVTRTCSYDRAGLGWSERGDAPYEPAATAEELRSLLEHAGEKPPFVLVGQGLGASLAAVFASRFSAETSALVVVDAPAGGEDAAESPFADVNRLTPWLARVGLLRAAGGLSDRATGLPPASEGALRAFLNRPDHLTRAADELSMSEDTAAQANGAALAALPVARVDTGSRGRIAFLTSESTAAPVVAAILEAVTRARAQGHSR